jgi:hypothetical protein
MGARPERQARACATRLTGALSLILGLLVLLGIAVSLSSSPGGSTAVHGATVALPSVQNSSNDGDPSGSSASIVCPSAGPVILGVQWDCVAILNLTELALILASIGIVAYVFKDADRAELPGESAEVPVTSEEWETYRRARKLGIPYNPPEPQKGDEEK